MKLCLNLCSLKWLKSRWSRVISLVPLGLWQLYTALAVGCVNWRIRRLSELQKLGSNLFHSEIVDSKKEFFKKTCFDLKMGRLCTFLVVYGACLTGIKWKRYSGCWFLNILWKRQSFLYQHRSLKDSKPNFWYIFFLMYPYLLLLLQVLYWMDSNLSWKELLNAWSYKISP